MKPVLVYVDDEPRNLTVFEATIPEDWQIVTFDSPVEALKKIKEIKPWVVISDQKMPQMTGLEFLEVVAQLFPEAMRIVVTGQTEEQTIIQLVRRAKIFDYLTKPWDSELLVSQIRKAIEFYALAQERQRALQQLEEKAKELEKANQREKELRTEIGAWVPAALVWAINRNELKLPAKKDLVGITYDIVGSSALHGKTVQDRSIHNYVQRLFLERLLKMGGIKESSGGDSIYGHFGAVNYPHNPHVAALMVAQEFRVALRSFSKMHGIPLECGMALHHAPDTLVQYEEIQVETPDGKVTQKWFDTSSNEVDLLHRMEKLSHKLPGSNIMMSEEFVARLPDRPLNITRIGLVDFKGQPRPVTVFAVLSDFVKPEQLASFQAENCLAEPAKQAG